MNPLSPTPGSGGQPRPQGRRHAGGGACRRAKSGPASPGTHRWACLPCLPFLPLLSRAPRVTVFSLYSCRPRLPWGALETRRAHVSRFASRSLWKTSTTLIRYTSGKQERTRKNGGLKGLALRAWWDQAESSCSSPQECGGASAPSPSPAPGGSAGFPEAAVWGSAGRPPLSSSSPFPTRSTLGLLPGPLPHHPHPAQGPSSEVCLRVSVLTFSPSCPGGPGSPISPCSQSNGRYRQSREERQLSLTRHVPCAESSGRSPAGDPSTSVCSRPSVSGERSPDPSLSTLVSQFTFEPPPRTLPLRARGAFRGSLQGRLPPCSLQTRPP